MVKKQSRDDVKQAAASKVSRQKHDLEEYKKRKAKNPALGIECENCGHWWPSNSDALKPTCPSCRHAQNKLIVKEEGDQ